MKQQLLGALKWTLLKCKCCNSQYFLCPLNMNECLLFKLHIWPWCSERRCRSPVVFVAKPKYWSHQTLPSLPVCECCHCAALASVFISFDFHWSFHSPLLCLLFLVRHCKSVMLNGCVMNLWHCCLWLLLNFTLFVDNNTGRITFFLIFNVVIIM